MPRGRRIYADRLLERAPEAPAPEPESERDAEGGPGEDEQEAELLDLQRTAGNAAVARMLQRDAAVPTSLGMRGGGSPSAPSLDLSAGLEDYQNAWDAVYAWFDGEVAEVKESGGGSFVQSVAELVDMAAAGTFTGKDGKPRNIRDFVKPHEIEIGLRERAKTLGIRLLDHRPMSDVAGVKAEAMAILRNLGKIPTEVEFGGDDSKITISIFGKITGEAKAGDAKLEAEVSPGGAEASVKTPGAKFGIQLTGDSIKAEIKAGDLVSVSGKVGHEKDGSVSWKADITIGTLGKVVTPAEIAKVMAGAQDTFSASAGELLSGLDNPEKIKEHGGALKDAVTEVVEKAKKSAAQAKSGWSLGVSVKGSESGGVSGTVTFTWVF
jgi:hypothetical protein